MRTSPSENTVHLAVALGALPDAARRDRKSVRVRRHVDHDHRPAVDLVRLADDLHRRLDVAGDLGSQGGGVELLGDDR